MAVTDLDSLLSKIPEPTSSQKSWADILSILARESEGWQSFKLS
jgi:hypothetical protein